MLEFASYVQIIMLEAAKFESSCEGLEMRKPARFLRRRCRMLESGRSGPSLACNVVDDIRDWS
jgi:hypothetical protein